jgi:hypothetical protein
MDDRSDSRIVHVVARDDESDGQDMVREHLPVIFTWFLRVNHVELVEPPAELSEVVEFREGGK